MEKCPFGNKRCMCQYCEDPCNNGLNCHDCQFNNKAVHDIYLCTGFKGGFKNYLNKVYGRED